MFCFHLGILPPITSLDNLRVERAYKIQTIFFECFNLEFRIDCLLESKMQKKQHTHYYLELTPRLAVGKFPNFYRVDH